MRLIKIITIIKNFYKNLYNIKLIKNSIRRKIFDYIINKILLKTIEKLSIFILMQKMKNVI